MLKAKKLPASISKSDSSMSNVNGDNLFHFFKTVLFGLIL
jgi:hypothetical protein